MYDSRDRKIFLDFQGMLHRSTKAYDYLQARVTMNMDLTHRAILKASALYLKIMAESIP